MVAWQYLERRIPDFGEGFTGHSGRVGMGQDMANTGVERPALMTAGRWKSSKMPARYTERQAVGRGAVAKYYQESGGLQHESEVSKETPERTTVTARATVDKLAAHSGGP